jgi:hypothetical protein
MITEDYVSFETAKLLKEKGFDESCYQKYDNEGYLSFNHVGYINNEKSCDDFCALAPTIQMAMKWLREVHNISVEPLVDFGSGDEYWWTADIGYIKKDGLIDELCGYNSYEEAAESAIKYCLENLIYNSYGKD